MKYKTLPLFLLSVIVLVVATCFYLWHLKSLARVDQTGVVIYGAKDPKNATYVIDGHVVTLINGVSFVPAAPSSAVKRDSLFR